MIYKWLWNNHADWMDAWSERKYRLRQRIAEFICRHWSHDVRTEGPGPWDWDGEPTVYCGRCETENPGLFSIDPLGWKDHVVEWFQIHFPSREARQWMRDNPDFGESQ